jgi:hypothetical protein
MTVKLVLLHSPLVGPGTWRLLAPALRARELEVALADFAADMAGDPPYYPRLVRTARALLAPARDTTTFVVVHSGAGSLVPAIATDVAGAIFVDALMPHPGQSWFETAPESLKLRLEKSAHAGHVPPWHRWWPDGAIRTLFTDEAGYVEFVAELNEIPLAYLKEPAPGVKLQERFRGAYLQLGPGNAAEASLAEQLGWPVRRQPLHHLALLTHPEVISDRIGELVTELTRN